MDIVSRENRWIRDYRKLSSDGKFRRETNRFVLEGVRLCEDAVKSGVTMETVLFTQCARKQYPSQLERIISVSPAYEITEALASYIGSTTTPQGIFCICIASSETLPLDKLDNTGWYAALECVQDPGNLGTMIRTAEALGLNGLLLSDGCCDPYNPKVLRASMGSVFRLPLYAAGNLSTRLPLLSQKGFVTVACVVDATAAPLTAVPLKRGTIAVIGNEGKGLTPATISACDIRATIPMLGRAESLNASMAAGIVFWEMMRKEDGYRG